MKLTFHQILCVRRGHQGENGLILSHGVCCPPPRHCTPQTGAQAFPATKQLLRFPLNMQLNMLQLRYLTAICHLYLWRRKSAHAAINVSGQWLILAGAPNRVKMSLHHYSKHKRAMLVQKVQILKYEILGSHAG